MRPLLFHPSRSALQAWLRGEVDDDAKLDAHVAVCKRCANTLERLDSEQEGESANSLAEALALALAPPDDLSSRLAHSVSQRLDSRVMFDVLTDLFGAGVETSRMLLLEEQGEVEDGDNG